MRSSFQATSSRMVGWASNQKPAVPAMKLRQTGSGYFPLPKSSEGCLDFHGKARSLLLRSRPCIIFAVCGYLSIAFYKRIIRTGLSEEYLVEYNITGLYTPNSMQSWRIPPWCDNVAKLTIYQTLVSPEGDDHYVFTSIVRRERQRGGKRTREEVEQKNRKITPCAWGK